MENQIDDSSVLPTSKQTLLNIRELSIRCRDLLNQMSTLDSITDAADARDTMTSFNIWAANLGVFEEGRLSIAYRLKDAPQVSHLTEQLLIELERHLDEVITMIRTGTYYDETSSTSESEDSSTRSSTPSYRLIESSDDDEPLPEQSKGSNTWASIENTMTGLRQLGLSIRLAGTQHLQERVGRFKKQNEPMYNMFKHLARQKVDHLFDKASETLRERMAESIATRRIRFLYLEKHQNKLSTLNSPEPALQDSKRIGQDTTNPAQSQLGNQKAEGLPTLEPPKATGVQSSQILSNTVTTKYNTKEIRPIQKAAERGGSVSSVVLNSTLPPIPKLDPGNTSFTCPFCFLVCPASEARGYERWKNHLIHDFAPFFCVYDECSSPFSSSETFTGLLTHMRDAHTQPKWRCWHCNTASSPRLFLSADELDDHLKDCHPTEFEDSLRSTVLEHSIIRAQHALRECPFCGGFPIEIEKRPSHQDREEALEKLEKHVREHLANVALILAPMETGEPVDTMSDSRSEAKTGKISERDIEGLSENNELECLNVRCDCHGTEKDSANEWPAKTNSNNCETENDSEIKRINEIWNVISEGKRKEFPDDHESQLACAVKYGFSYWPENLSLPSSPQDSPTQKSQEEFIGRTASQETKVWTHADYTVGWICALPLDYTAATALLDQRHPDLPKRANDQLSYTLGSISGHNIVIVCLPKGIIRRTSAAIVAEGMLSTFPAIVWSFSVGIGAGIPSNEVRLGDVVVSTPTSRSPGVVMWDVHKVHGEFVRIGTLTTPPSSMLTALAALESQHFLNGTEIPKYSERLKEQWPRLSSSYLKSDSLEDLLFKADYKHVTDPEEKKEEEGEGESCRLCDKSMIVMRRPREMRIHHGLIASGNMVIRDAKFRDKLNKNLGDNVLCIDMEAAGLKHDFPCLIIRGICDYADSHTNKDWRGHAAFVAAAFTKELLQYLRPRDIESEKPVKDLLSDEVHSFTPAVHEDPTQIVSRKSREQDLQVLNWLTTTDYRLQQNDYLGRRQPGTGSWLLETTEYRTWLATPGQFLFCQGIPGAGKTILTSVAIDHLTSSFSGDSSTGLAYIYCSFRRHNQQTPVQLFACILKQLAECLPSLPDAVQSLFDAHQNGRTRPSLKEILITLQAVIVEIPSVFIVIDALDEHGVVKSSLETFLVVLARFQQQYSINILATSRVELNIALQIKHNFSNLVYLDLRASNDDIASYIEGNLSRLPRPIQNNRGLLDFVKTVILEAADGMFLLAFTYLELLRGQTSERAIRHELRAVEEGKGQGATVLVALYQETVNRIEQQVPYRSTLAKQILMWLAHAKRELTVTELQDALVTKPLLGAVGSPDLLDDDELLAMCAGLVTIDRSRNIIRLAHRTVQEYVKLRSSEFNPSIQQDIARTCLAYLSLDRFTEGNYTQWQELEEWLTSYPFYYYAATNWGHHARESSLPIQELMQFFDDRAAVKNSIAVLMVGESSRAHTYVADPPKPESVSSLHLAAYFGLANLVLELLITGLDSDPRDSQGRTPLSYAAELGREEIVFLFLRFGAEPDSTGLKDHENTGESSWLPTNNGGHAGRTPLSFAAEYGHVDASMRLLRHGVNPDSECSKHHYQGWTPLLFAVHHGHENVVRLLLEMGANPVQPSMNDKDFGKPPLSHAAEKGHEAIVRLILMSGVSVDLQDNQGKTPLSYAAQAGRLEVVRLLLEEGANEYLEDNEGETPRSRAISNGTPEVIAMFGRM